MQPLRKSNSLGAIPGFSSRQGGVDEHADHACMHTSVRDAPSPPNSRAKSLAALPLEHFRALGLARTSIEVRCLLPL